MSTATLQDLQFNFERIVQLIERGEEVAITRQGKNFAVFAPAKEELSAKPNFKVPDFAAQLREVFGDRSECVLSEEDSIALRENMRG